MFDSGIGGLTVLRELINEYPNTEYIYYADTLNLPYGEKTKEQLLEIGKNIIEFLDSKKVDVIVIACGTCSSLVESYRELTETPVFDVITPTVEYVKKHYKNVGLIATKSTIDNKIFENKLTSKGINVKATSCPSFVPFIEGLKDTYDIEELNILKDSNLEVIILGCTHYPLLQDKIESYLGISSIVMGKCVSALIDLPNNDQESIEIYLSKYLPNIESKINEILGKEININILKK